MMNSRVIRSSRVAAILLRFAGQSNSFDRTVDIRWERSVGLPRQNIAGLTLERLADARQGIKADAFDFT